ncbi:MAG TPA: ABC transporter permease [Candidatus Scatosoma pullicola]|nr:ABC transporter permease [Candidatus Scatosoma pullicola]
MFAELAFRNVKRQVGNYLIYFITVSLTVAMMFAVNGAVFSPALTDRISGIADLKGALIFLTAFVAIIVSFVLGYASSFILRLRKREFGTCLTLGMTRRDVLRLYFLENALLCGAALAAGLLLGMFFYQALMAVIANLMEAEYAFSPYTVKGFVLTAGVVAGVFLLSSLASSAYLRKVSVAELLHGDKKAERETRHPVFWLAVALLSFAAIVFSCVFFSREVERGVRGEGSGGNLMLAFVLLSVAVVLFHYAAAKSVVRLLLRCRKLKNRGTNAFTLRRLSVRLSSDALLSGALAFLLAFAVIGANVSFVQKISNDAILAQSYPFDVGGRTEAGEEAPVPFDEAERIIEDYAQIESAVYTAVYTSGERYLHGFTPWSGEEYAGLTDCFLTESDFNALYVPLGFEPVHTDGGFYIYSGSAVISSADFSAAFLELPGGPYLYRGTLSGYPDPQFSCYFCAVVPDKAAEGLEEDTFCAAYTLTEELSGEEARSLEEALSYEYTPPSGEEFTYFRCDYDIRELARMSMNASSAILIVSALYLAVVFVFLAMAILALKTLSQVSEDRGRYEVLYRLGVGRREQGRTLFAQIFACFFLPFALPVSLSIPAGLICAQVMRLGGFAVTGIAGMTAGIALVLTSVYVLYFMATWLVAKRKVVRD